MFPGGLLSWETFLSLLFFKFHTRKLIQKEWKSIKRNGEYRRSYCNGWRPFPPIFTSVEHCWRILSPVLLWRQSHACRLKQTLCDGRFIGGPVYSYYPKASLPTLLLVFSNQLLDTKTGINVYLNYEDAARVYMDVLHFRGWYHMGIIQCSGSQATFCAYHAIFIVSSHCCICQGVCSYTIVPVCGGAGCKCGTFHLWCKLKTRHTPYLSNWPQ